MADPMKIRAQLKGDVADVKILIFHPMETGLRKDAVTGQPVPMHIIQNLTATLNGKTVLEAQWSQAVSKNPFLNFRVRGAKAGDKLLVGWVDNRGEKASMETILT
ncbi:MAG TPA: thiosulfate oxidation carrier complex protein SoxZ [Burkholderiales bacterium]|jgi:sulfur-oxidizing protein SoxZ|nr:thiosulfate oxidation carrier complex protein SoxZ [Burkholderiales bacterium]